MQMVFGRLILLFLCLFLLHGALAQRKEKDLQSYIPTENISSKKDFNKRKHAPKRKNIRLIVKNSPKGILYGNPCMMEETRRMGFEYAVQSKGLPGSMGFFRRNWNNFVTKLRLTFTNTPFWKLILNFRVKDCREKTGDIVG
jgi:hypothetical protein